ncbi:glycosyltransferase family 2 protein [Compostimonas suwonensis]|uniref:Cellulose synthase/poly-beta-1,6-N-acetylglucosamine synthase-like glycosyltransferase n=1 Tax=Compostimonas suwonensis TaxID=1048394 RepID=A0A2M9BUC0_9MICO|nr:glycosyltransferase family 2 protein [Compostimonas suwonensis]PJJ61533.1 cellulose synthase/poly-beta-1,6-N-acetylglucosamine synthase-like glycosyltransferase [Compostimonas suwonensis]
MTASESAQALAFVLLVIFLGYILLILTPFLRRKKEAEGDPSGFSWHVLVPCRDEEAVIGATIDRLRRDFPEAHLWIIDDDSDDGTAGIVEDRMSRDPLVHLVSRRRPDARTGKGAALNAAYRALSAWMPADADRSSVVVLVVDADGRLAQNALRQAAGEAAFGNPLTGAAQAAVWMSNRDDRAPVLGHGGRLNQWWGRYLVRMQDIEFRTTIAAMQSLRKHTVSVGLGGNGQFTRLSVLDEISATAGEPWHGSLLEDYELGIHVMLAGYRTVYMHDTYVEQEALPGARRLLTQRTRWCQGGMQCTRYLRSIFESRYISNAGALEATYFLMMPFIQLLGVVLWPTVFIVMIAQGAINSGSLGLWLAESWWLLPLIVITGILPFWIWAPIYRSVAEPRHSLLTAALWGIGYWLYMYQTYVCVLRAFFRIVIGRDGWAKTRRNSEKNDIALVAKES